MTPREQRVQAAVEAMGDALESQALTLDDSVSAVFSLTLRVVVALRTMGADMHPVQGPLMRLVAEAMPDEGTRH